MRSPGRHPTKTTPGGRTKKNWNRDSNGGLNIIHATLTRFWLALVIFWAASCSVYMEANRPTPTDLHKFEVGQVIERCPSWLQRCALMMPQSIATAELQTRRELPK